MITEEQMSSFVGKEFDMNTRGIGLGQQHGHRCIVLRRDILCNRTSGASFTEPRSHRVATDTEVDGG